MVDTLASKASAERRRGSTPRAGMVKLFGGVVLATVKSHKVSVVGAGGATARQSYATQTTACAECGLTHADQEGTVTGDGNYLVTWCPTKSVHNVTPLSSVTLI